MEDMVRIFPRATSERRASLYAFMKGALTGTIFSFILLGIVYLLASKLVDWSLIVSLWIAELPLATFFYFLFGEREQSARRRTIDAIEKAHAVLEYQHLQIHWVNEWDDYDYPALSFFVLNTRTKKAFHSPEYIHELEAGQIIESIEYESDEELDASFKKEGIILERREPKPSELL